MRKVRFLALTAGLLAGLVGLAGSPAAAQPGQWATVKGQVVFPAAKPVPERPKLDVSQDKAHCLSKGDILDESVIVNPKNRGIKNVVVWLRPDSKSPKAKLTAAQINPADKARKPAQVVIDQPCCMFVGRVTTARVGDTVVVKNPAPVAHNFFWTAGDENGEYNVTIPKESQWVMPNALKAQSSPIEYKCTIHPWMKGYFRVFDHPYFATTDENGNFEIKGAPVGKFRMVVWHEKVGYLGGRDGRFGIPVEIKPGTTEVKVPEFNVVPAP